MIRAGALWPYGMKLSISVGLHSGEAGVGRAGPAVGRCMELCDTAEGGQIVMFEATAALLDDEDPGGLSVRDLGNQSARRTDSVAHVYEWRNSIRRYPRTMHY